MNLVSNLQWNISYFHLNWEEPTNMNQNQKSHLNILIYLVFQLESNNHIWTEERSSWQLFVKDALFCKIQKWQHEIPHTHR